MKVYVSIVRIHERDKIIGVFATPELANAACDDYKCKPFWFLEFDLTGGNNE